MQPVLWEQPFQDDAWGYQVKWDGVRMLAFVSRDGVTLQNRRIHMRTAQYPELQQLRDLVRPCVLDGEVIVLRDGKPSFSSVMTRDQQRGTIRPHPPVHYVIFDVLAIEGREHLDTPWQERQRLLSAVAGQLPDPFLVTDTFHDGIDLYEATRNLELEGIVAKRLDSPYTFGKSPLWRKVKHRREVNALVGGVTVREGNLSGLLLGAYAGEQLRYIGRAGTGLNEKTRAELLKWAKSASQTDSPFDHDIKVTGADVIYVRPALTAHVTFAEWTDDLHLRAPVISGFGEEAPESCQL
jgi:DNA ligase D-like protein (predicted ligase)